MTEIRRTRDENRPVGEAPTSICPRCGMAFTCGMKAGAPECWCARLPVLAAPLDSAVGCYCPQCLQALASAGRGAGADAGSG